ncbi:hypothetical protein JCM8115_002762 [Rhodotorula mucilaginosa]|uniref:Uncharacterized protein n=1 Tax=Rhodotorula mucilaginosa TaxID=5537 RepID=A0A9P7B3S3_RHOMI|nr:hypothetical protein C6P46_006309 [Rhodotorula mucilaginosa]
MGGYGSYGAANAYGNSSLSAASGTGMNTRNTGTLSSEEEDATPTRNTSAANITPTFESSAHDLAQETKGTHKDLKGFRANFEKLRDHLQKHLDAATPEVHDMVNHLADHLHVVEARAKEAEEKARAHHATFSTNTPIAAHSMGRAPSAFTSGSYSRYRY